MLTLLVATALAQSISIRDEGASQGWARALNCTGSGITCSVDTATRVATISSSGGPGGGVPDSIPAITYSVSADLSQERVLSAGNYTTVDLDTPSQAQVDWTHGLTCTSGQALTSSGTAAMACTSTLTASDVACAGTCVADAEIAGVAGGKVSGAVASATLAAAATALAADPTDCTAGQYAKSINASGALTCEQVTLASTATALAANPTDCGASQYATAIDASGNLTCAAVSVAGLPAFRRLTADHTNSTVTFSSSALSWTVLTGTTYVIDCALFYTTAVSTTALQVSLLGPTTSAIRYHVNTETAATTSHAATQTAWDANTNPATGAAAVPLAVYLSGSFVTTAGGTLAVRTRSEVAASLTTVLVGSWCSLTAI